jgi:hypothetical protein
VWSTPVTSDGSSGAPAGVCGGGGRGGGLPVTELLRRVNEVNEAGHLLVLRLDRMRHSLALGYSLCLYNFSL